MVYAYAVYLQDMMRRRHRCTPENTAFQYISLQRDPEYLTDKFIDDEIGIIDLLIFCCN